MATLYRFSMYSATQSNCILWLFNSFFYRNISCSLKNTFIKLQSKNYYKNWLKINVSNSSYFLKNCRFCWNNVFLLVALLFLQYFWIEPEDLTSMAAETECFCAYDFLILASFQFKITETKIKCRKEKCPNGIRNIQNIS